MDLFERSRATAGSEQGRASFIAQYSSTYIDVTMLYYQEHQNADAFRTSERGRARAFLNSLATGNVQLNDHENADLLTREQQTYRARELAQKALAAAHLADPFGLAAIRKLKQQLMDAEQQHNQALAAIEQRGGQLSALVPSRTKGVLEVTEVQQLLDPQTTLLSFFSGEEQTLAFIVTRDRFQTVALAVPRTELHKQIEALRDSPDGLKQPHSSEAITLYQTLIARSKHT